MCTVMNWKSVGKWIIVDSVIGIRPIYFMPIYICPDAL